jgi:hypothetical protein
MSVYIVCHITCAVRIDFFFCMFVRPFDAEFNRNLLTLSMLVFRRIHSLAERILNSMCPSFYTHETTRESQMDFHDVWY